MNDDKDILCKQLDNYFRYDKKLLFNLFIYFLMFEKFLRDELTNENIYKLKEVDKLLFSKVLPETYWTNFIRQVNEVRTNYMNQDFI